MAGDPVKLTRKGLKNIIETVLKESSISMLLEAPEGIQDPSEVLRDGAEERLRSALLNNFNSLSANAPAGAGDALPGGTKARDLAEVLTSLILGAATYGLDPQLFQGLIQLQAMMDPQIQQAAAQIQQMQQMQAQAAALAQQTAQVDAS